MQATLSVLNYLHSYQNGYSISGGIAYDDLLRGYNLDYSIESLHRIDEFLDKVREIITINETEFTKSKPHANLFFVLVAYVGELLGRALQKAPNWLTHQELMEKMPLSDIFPDNIYHALSIEFNDGSQPLGKVFFPMHAMGARVFDEYPDKSVYFSTVSNIPQTIRDLLKENEQLPPCPKQSPFNHDVLSIINNLPLVKRTYLQVIPPPWMKSKRPELYSHQIEAMPLLYKTGRVVWAVLIQANKLMFEHGEDSCPGEIIYDRDGRLPVEALMYLSRNLSALKNTAPQQADQRQYAAHLTNEQTTVLNNPLPPSICGISTVRTSSIWFWRRHLPDGILSLGYFPILVSDVDNLSLTVLPSRFWPDSLRQTWLQNSFKRFNQNYEIEPAILKEEEEEKKNGFVFETRQLFQPDLYDVYGESSSNVSTIDNDKNEFALLEKAQSGHLPSMLALVSLYQTENPQLAFYFALRAAESGNTEGQILLAELFVQGKGVRKDQKQAMKWLKRAIAQGNREAEPILKAVNTQWEKDLVVGRNYFFMLLAVIGFIIWFIFKG